MSEVRDALEVAAGSGDDGISAFGLGTPSTSSKRRITGARTVIKVFLENLPAGMTVGEIIDALED